MKATDANYDRALCECESSGDFLPCAECQKTLPAGPMMLYPAGYVLCPACHAAEQSDPHLRVGDTVLFQQREGDAPLPVVVTGLSYADARGFPDGGDETHSISWFEVNDSRQVVADIEHKDIPTLKKWAYGFQLQRLHR